MNPTALDMFALGMSFSEMITGFPMPFRRIQIDPACSKIFIEFTRRKDRFRLYTVQARQAAGTMFCIVPAACRAWTV